MGKLRIFGIKIIHKLYDYRQFLEGRQPKTGEKIAKTIYERHNVLSILFMNLGVDKKTAVEDACRIEHYISDATFNAIKAHLKKYGTK